MPLELQVSGLCVLSKLINSLGDDFLAYLRRADGAVWFFFLLKKYFIYLGSNFTKVIYLFIY